MAATHIPDPTQEMACCGEPLGSHEEGWCPHEIEEGERIRHVPALGATWLVTRWAPLGGPHFYPIEQRRLTAAEAREVAADLGGSV